MNIDMSLIQETYDALNGGLIPLAFGICAFLALCIFFINFKRKTGLIYIAVSLIFIGAVLYVMGNFIPGVLETLIPEYASLASSLLSGVFAGLKNMSYIYFGIAAFCIILFIILKVLKKKKAEKKESAVSPAPEVPAEEAPAEEVPAEEIPAGETPVNETLTEETPVEENTVEESPQQ